MLQVILGLLVIAAVIFLLIKRAETRMVLFAGGLALFIIAGDPMGTFSAFTTAIGRVSLFEPIITVMGYSAVMKLVGADKHLVRTLTKPLQKTGPFLIFGVTIATFLINISLTSTAGISAATGAIFIPMMVAAGIHPAISAAAILAGTYGSFLNPGYPMNVLTSEVSGAEIAQVISRQSIAIIVAVIGSGIVLSVVARIRKEHTGYHDSEIDSSALTEDFKVNYLYALLPLMPIVLIMLSYLIPGYKGLAISHSVLISILITMLVIRKTPGKIVGEFFKGAGTGFANIFGIIVTASVFTAGLEAVGLVDALINLMISNPSIAKVSSSLGPWAMAVLTGSGEAATTAFNTAVTVNASQFGIDPIAMGSVAGLAGAFGRAMSPLAGGAIILGGFGKVDTMQIAKRSAPGMVFALIATTIILLFI